MIYIELTERLAVRNRVFNPGIYCSEDAQYPAALAYRAKRMWQEEGGTVGWFKNVDAHDSPVDMAEFLFIKLKAQRI